MKVIATKPGYDNVKYREVGDEFDMPEGSKGSWFQPVAVKAEPVKAEKSKKGSKVDAADDIT